MSYDSEIAADNPVLYHSLNATPADTLTEVGTVTYVADGPNGGGAARLNGSSYFQSADPYPAYLRPSVAVTAEIWVRNANSSGYRAMLGTPVAGSGPYGYDLGMFPNTPRWETHQGGVSSIYGPTSITDGVWHHIVGTATDGERCVYVDGVLVASDTRAGTIDYRTDEFFLVGARHQNGADYLMDGDLAAVAIYDTVLDADRVAAHYAASRVAAPTPVTGAVAFTGTGSLSVTAEPDPLFAAVNFTGSATLTVGPAPDPETETAFAAVTFGATGTLDVVARPVGRRRRLIVVDLDGSPLGELENATCGAITYTLNEPEDWSFTLPMSDPKAALLLSPRFREVQVWRGDQLLAWGPAVRPSADKSHLAVSCKGAGWYLSRRSIGDASRRNYLVNGDFEDGLSGWNIGALNPLEPIATRGAEHYVAEIATDRVLTGTHSLYLAQVATGTPKYGVSAGQFLIWTVDPATHPEGDEFSFSARCYIPSETWRGPPADNVGLRLDRFSTTESVLITPEGGGDPVAYPKPIETITATIDENTARDVWLPLDAVMVAPVTGAPEFVQVVLYCPDGGIIWDRATLTIDEGLRFHGQDQALIVAGIVDHLQDPAYGKTYLNLWTDTPATGVIRDRTYLHHEHIGGADAIAEFTTLHNGLDVSVAYTPSSRTVRTHHPARGVYRPGYGLELGKNIADFAWTFDGESAASQVIVLGSGDGSDREEASATLDPLGDQAYADGLTLETVFTAPTTTLLDSLDDVANETLAVANAPEVLAVTCTSPGPGQPDPVGVLTVGDTVPVRIRAGALVIDDTYRIVELILTPDDTLELTLNKRTVT